MCIESTKNLEVLEADKVLRVQATRSNPMVATKHTAVLQKLIFFFNRSPHTEASRPFDQISETIITPGSIRTSSPTTTRSYDY